MTRDGKKGTGLMLTGHEGKTHHLRRERKYIWSRKIHQNYQIFVAG
jgi:hypothetical protein